MTWVIAMAGLLSRGILIGDTRVTLQDHTGARVEEFDGVWKVHAIHDNIAMGFAGNIDAGFKMVSDLRVTLANSIPSGTMTNEPSRLILSWARRARYHWEHSLTDAERSGGCSLLYVAARPPHSVVGITPNIAYTLESPSFVPKLAPWLTAVAIGSGNDVEEYVVELEKISQERNNLLGFDNPAWDHLGGPLIVLSAVLGERIREVGAEGIGHHLTLCSVQWGRVLFGTNEGVGFKDDHRAESWPDTIARDWAEWQRVKQWKGIAKLVAVA